MLLLVVMLMAVVSAASAQTQNCLHSLIDVSMDSDGSAYTLRAKLFPPAAESPSATTVTLFDLDIYPDPLGTPKLFHIDGVKFVGAHQTPASSPHLVDQFGGDHGPVTIEGSSDSVWVRGISAAALGNPDQFVWDVERHCVNGNTIQSWIDWYPAPPPVASAPPWWPGVPPVTNIALPTKPATWGKLKQLYR
jgi:hypothetical protein